MNIAAITKDTVIIADKEKKGLEWFLIDRMIKHLTYTIRKAKSLQTHTSLDQMIIVPGHEVEIPEDAIIIISRNEKEYISKINIDDRDMLGILLQVLSFFNGSLSDE